MTQEQSKRLNGWEDHIKTGLVSLIAAGVGWMCLELTEVSSETKVNQNMIKNIQANMERIADNQYPNSEAKRDWEIQRQRDKRQNEKIKNIKTRMDSHLHQIRDLRTYVQQYHDGSVAEVRE